MALVQGIMGRRTEDANDKRSMSHRPLFVWEPIPDLCAPEHIGVFKQAIQQVDVVSPNSEELAGFFLGGSESQIDMAAQTVGWGIGPSNSGFLVVREGKNGCSAFWRKHQIHLAAYHSPVRESQLKVVDPTGGGNAFLGALAMALAGENCSPMARPTQILALDRDSTSDPFLHSTLSLAYAIVAASFAIEQPGMPIYRVQGDGAETWNGETFEDRLEAYLNREQAYLIRQMKR